MSTADKAGIERAPFGVTQGGVPVERVTLRGADGFEAVIMTYGAAIHALKVPDRAGASEDILLGNDDLAGYVAQRRYFGATIGRYANRIAAARFVLDGKSHQLDVNNGINMLHGGNDGFDRKVWSIAVMAKDPQPAVVLTYTSPHGEGGFPGELTARAIYRLTGPTELSLTYEATTDRPTMVSLTNHAFFNLNGALSGCDILDHRLMIAADHFLAVDASAIPLATPPRAVDGTPFDFRQPTIIGARIRNKDEQLQRGRGYDHNYCLRASGDVRLAARLEAPRTGRAMDLLTDQPGLQFYSGNFLDGTYAGKGDRLYRQSDAVCLEPHAWPDTPNRPDFPSARLDPGQLYRRTMIYRFGTVPKE
jgi:aldose 1-epimerase